MNSRDYWRQREKENQLKILEAQKNYDKELKRIYDQVQLNIQRDINNFYAKYYNQKQGWTLADVKKSVSEFDVKEFENKAKEYVKNKDFSAEANERLKLYNLTMKVNRLEMLKADIGLEMLKGSDDLDKHVKESLLREAKEEAERQAGILGRTVKSLDFSENSLKGIINGSWQQTSFSDRIWGYNDKLKGVLDGMIPQMIIQGKHPTALTKDLNRIFGSARFEAERLLRTESSRVYGEMAKDAIGKAGYKEYEWIAEPKACDVCGPMNGKVFDTKSAEFGKSLFPMHPNCRCSIIPVIPDFDIDDYLEKGNVAIDKAMKGYNGNNAEEVKKTFDRMLENYSATNKNNGIIKASNSLSEIKKFMDGINLKTATHNDLTSLGALVNKQFNVAENIGNKDELKKIFSNFREIGGEVPKNGWSKGSGKEARRRVSEAFSYYPKEWAEYAFVNGKAIYTKDTQRGFFSSVGFKGKTWRSGIADDAVSIMLSKGSNTVSFHEIGHYVEFFNPEALRLSKEFVEYRTKGEQEIDMQDLQYWYRRGEKTKKDNFISPYIGKSYKNATEVLSMGLESIFEPEDGKIFSQPTRSSELIRKKITDDLEYLNFIIGMYLKG